MARREHFRLDDGRSVVGNITGSDVAVVSHALGLFGAISPNNLAFVGGLEAEYRQVLAEETWNPAVIDAHIAELKKAALTLWFNPASGEYMATRRDPTEWFITYLRTQFGIGRLDEAFKAMTTYLGRNIASRIVTGKYGPGYMVITTDGTDAYTNEQAFLNNIGMGAMYPNNDVILDVRGTPFECISKWRLGKLAAPSASFPIRIMTWSKTEYTSTASGVWTPLVHNAADTNYGDGKFRSPSVTRANASLEVFEHCFGLNHQLHPVFAKELTAADVDLMWNDTGVRLHNAHEPWLKVGFMRPLSGAVKEVRFRLDESLKVSELNIDINAASCIAAMKASPLPDVVAHGDSYGSYTADIQISTGPMGVWESDIDKTDIGKKARDAEQDLRSKHIEPYNLDSMTFGDVEKKAQATRKAFGVDRKVMVIPRSAIIAQSLNVATTVRLTFAQNGAGWSYTITDSAGLVTDDEELQADLQDALETAPWSIAVAGDATAIARARTDGAANGGLGVDNAVAAVCYLFTGSPVPEVYEEGRLLGNKGAGPWTPAAYSVPWACRRLTNTDLPELSFASHIWGWQQLFESFAGFGLSIHMKA